MKETFENHYEVLGVPEYASFEQIDQAYKQTSRRLDRVKIWQGVFVRDREVTRDQVYTAYSVLTSPSRRRRFDRLIAHMRKCSRLPQDPSVMEQLPQVKPIELLSYCEQLYIKGMKHIEEKQYEKALLSLNKLNTMEGRNPRILRLIARTYMLSGTISFAIKAAKRAAELQPGNVENLLLLGRIGDHPNRRRFTHPTQRGD